MSKLDNLNEQVAAAIFELEEAERKVSRLEEKIAELTLPTFAEGRIARRDAVRAAVAAGEEERAIKLVNRFLTEAGIDRELRKELVALL